jgi:hypothetical protein
VLVGVIANKIYTGNFHLKPFGSFFVNKIKKKGGMASTAPGDVGGKRYRIFLWAAQSEPPA